MSIKSPFFPHLPLLCLFFPPPKQGLLRSFRRLDADKSGEIDFDEFKKVLTTYQLNVPEAQQRVLFNRYDKDGGGSISLYEFVDQVLPPDFEELPDDAYYGDEVDKEAAMRAKANGGANGGS